MIAMAVVTPLGVMAQRWMTYELLSVDGGLEEWCFVIVVLAVLGVLTALFMGVPACWVTTRLGLRGWRRTLVFCGLAAVLTAVAHRALAPLGRSAFDHVAILALAFAFFAIFHACYVRGFGDADL